MATTLPDDTTAFDSKSFDAVYSQYRQVPKRHLTAGILGWTASLVVVGYFLIAAVAGIIAGG